MSLLDQASLVAIPSGYKAGTIFSQVPVPIEGTEEVVNGNFATDSDWAKNDCWTISNGKATCDGTAGRMFQGGVSTAGKFYKVTYDIVDYTSGAFRISLGSGAGITNTAVGSYSEVILAGGNSNLYVNNGGTTGALSVDNISVKELTPYGDLDFTRSTTATRVNESGLIETVAINTPRLDFTGGGCGKYLFEPQRTNTIPYSSNFSNSWTNAGTNPITNDAIQSPKDGVLAQKITYGNTYGQHYFRQILNGHTVGEDYTFSVFAKAGELDSLTLRLFNGTNGNVTFDLTNGTITSGTNGKIEDYGNGWYRCTGYFVATSTYLYPYLYLVLGNTQGDGTSGIYWWNAQLEEGSYATSAIETESSTVTRTADASGTTGLSSVINSEEGVFMLGMAALANDLNYKLITLSDGTNNNRIFIAYSNVSQEIRVQFFSGGVLSASMTYAVADITDIHNVAIRYKENDFSLWIDGLERATDTTGSTMSAGTMDRVTFANANGVSSVFYGKISELVLTEYLTDTQMVQLTTL